MRPPLCHREQLSTREALQGCDSVGECRGQALGACLHICEDQGVSKRPAKGLVVDPDEVPTGFRARTEHMSAGEALAR